MKELRPTSRSTKLLNDFFVFDIETGDKLKNGDVKWKLDATPKSFIFACVVGKGYRHVMHSPRECQQEFQHPRYKGKIVFAHNAEYDLNGTFGNIYQFDNRAIFNGRFIKAGNGNCTFADSMNILKMSVAEIGKLLGFPKLTLGSKLKTKAKDMNKAVEYCYRDCDIVYYGLQKIFEDAGTIRLTQASLSMALFRSTYQEKTIKHNEFQEYFFDSYYGGRVEAFRLGKCHGQVIDRNSAYPAEMLNTKFPDPERIGCAMRVPVKLLMKYLYCFEGCAYVSVRHPDKWLGLLPVKKDGKLIFPIGHFSGCWNFNELRFAVENGIEIISVDKIFYAPGVESPFKRYVTELYAKRLITTDDFESTRIKVFMNSLYGKFAQRIKEEFIYLPNWRKETSLITQHQRQGSFIELQMFNRERLDAFLVVKAISTKEGLPYAIPSIASYITSGQRVELAKKMLENEKFEILYCDTDAYVTGKPSGHKDQKELGGWKIESKVITCVHGLKNYEYQYLDKKTGKLVKDFKIKGVPKKATKLSANKFEFLSMIKTKEGLRRNIDSGIFVKKQKVIKKTYDKRKLFSGGITEPIKLTSLNPSKGGKK